MEGVRRCRRPHREGASRLVWWVRWDKSWGNVISREKFFGFVVKGQKGTKILDKLSDSGSRVVPRKLVILPSLCSVVDASTCGEHVLQHLSQDEDSNRFACSSCLPPLLPLQSNGWISSHWKHASVSPSTSTMTLASHLYFVWDRQAQVTRCCPRSFFFRTHHRQLFRKQTQRIVGTLFSTISLISTSVATTYQLSGTNLIHRGKML